jgi:hypothetical protein
MDDPCRVYWGHAGCGLPRGHDPGQAVRTHRQFEPSEQAATVTEKHLFGEDLTEEEQRIAHDLWE